MVEMSDVSRQQKLASAKKKLKKFQQGKSPNNAPSKDNLDLSQDIIHGLQNNHIFRTPPLTVKNNETNSGNQIKNNTKQATNNINQNLHFNHDVAQNNKNVNPVSPLELFGGPHTTEDISKQVHTPNGTSSADNSPVKVNDETEQIISYKRSNQQLSNQVGEQRKQILQLQEKLKDYTNASQKVTDQRALKEQLEVHIQTIGILVSEKSELQSNIANLQKKMTTKDTEINDLNGLLKATETRLTDFQKNAVEMKDSEDQLQKENKEVASERDRISARLYQVSNEKEELNLRNSELQSKLQVKIGECDTLSKQLNELHIRLQNGEINAHSAPENTERWEEEKEKLVKTLEEHKNILQRLVSDKAELLQKNNDTQTHYETQIEELQKKVDESEVEKSALLNQSQILTENLRNVQQQLNMKDIEENSAKEPVTDTSMREIDEMREQKDCIEQELDVQIQENRRLSRLMLEQTEKIEDLESKIVRLHTESVDKSSLLEQIQSDKETVSRALQQNKILKEQLVELEEGFVKMSTTSADLTTKLESEQHGSKEMAEKFSGVKVELEETKAKLLERSRTCDQLSGELNRYKEQLHVAQVKLSSKEMDVEFLETELETSHVQQQNSQTGEFERNLQLQEQLKTAQETIEHLNIQNDQLQTTLRNMHFAQNEMQTGQGFAQTEASSSEEDSPTDEGDENIQDDENTQDSREAVKPMYEGSTTTTEDFDEENAIRVSRDELERLQKTLSDLQGERERILHKLHEERERAFSDKEKLEEHVTLKVQQLTVQRERELQEHFYEQTEALQKKVQSLHEALEIMRKNEDIAEFDMASDGITMPLLKTAFMQLQKRYKSAMDSKAFLSDRIEQLEHMNMRLESETETIGEYITLYQSQRQAMKHKFEEKDEIINRISNEHGRMQAKVSQLHQLVMQMLSERSGFESKNKQLQELVNRRLAIQTGESSESEVPKLQYNLDSLFGEITVTPDEENELIKDNISVDEHTENTVSDQTTQQILNLFEQLETTGEGYQYGWLSPAARKHSFLPCKNCTGELLSL